MNTTLYDVIARIREAAGVGAGPMLSELPDAIAKLAAEKLTEIASLRAENSKLWRVAAAAAKFETGLSDYCDGEEREELRSALEDTKK